MKTILMNFFSKLFDMFFGQIKIGTSKKADAPVRSLDFRNYGILRSAKAEIGVKEVSGVGNDERIVKYHAYATEMNLKGMNDAVPWCSSFLCFIMETTKVRGKFITSTNSMAARSWLKWGVSVKDDPMPGDVVVYWRGKIKGWQGHTGIFLGERNGHIFTLGGNQRDAVNISSYARVKLLDIRRSSKHVKLNDVQMDFLNSFAERILRENGHRIEGSVS